MAGRDKSLWQWIIWARTPRLALFIFLVAMVLPGSGSAPA